MERPSADDLICLLAVVATGRYTSAAKRLGVNHTTVSRRIERLESIIGSRVITQGAAGTWEATRVGARLLESAHKIEEATKQAHTAAGTPDVQGLVRVLAPDGFAAYLLSAAAVQLRRRFSEIEVEIVTTTRRASQQRSDIDIEIVVGEPKVNRAICIKLCDYSYGLYVSRSYLEDQGLPASLGSLKSHPVIYFADTMLRVDSLDISPSLGLEVGGAISGSNTFVHVEATRLGGGVGLLAAFMARRHPELVRVLRDEVDVMLSYWLVARRETLQRPEVTELIGAIRNLLTEQRDHLLDL